MIASGGTRRFGRGNRAREEEVRGSGETESAMSSPRNIVVYVDVDDTLIRSFGSKQIPISSVIEHVRRLCAEDGVTAYCWSSGGADYARAVAERLGIAELFVAFLPKPNLMIDDQAPSAWRDLLVVHPNETGGKEAQAIRQALGWTEA